MKLYPILFLFFIFSFLRNHFAISDEAVNLQMIKNISVHGAEFATRPSYDPGGHENWQRDALPHILMPPVFHFFNLGFHQLIRIDLIKTAAILQYFFLIAFLLILIRSRGLLKHIEVLFLSFIPVYYFLLIEHEGGMVLWGFLSLNFASLGLNKNKLSNFFLSGFFLGLGFLFKLWLVAPFGVALIFLLLFSCAKKEYSILNYLKFSSLLISTFVLTSSAHLIYVHFSSPGDVGSWLNQVYFGFITGAGDYGSKANSEGWGHPWYYYLYCLIRDLAPILPLVVIFSKRLSIKEFKIHDGFLVGCFGILFSIIPLSFLASKEPAYILPIYISLIILVMEMLKQNSSISKNEMKLSLISLIPILTFFFFSITGKMSKTLTLEFMTLSGICYLAMIVSMLFQVTVKKNIQTILPIIGLLTTISYFELNFEKDIDLVSNFIKNREGNLISENPRNTFIISDAYSQFGYKVWNRVLKYNWVIKKENPIQADFNGLLGDKNFKYFITNKNAKNFLLIKKASEFTQLKFKEFTDLAVYFRP